jgi:hypothetical protein
MGATRQNRWLADIGTIVLFLIATTSCSFTCTQAEIAAIFIHNPRIVMNSYLFSDRSAMSLVALGDGRFSLDTLILHGSEAFQRQFLRRFGRH